MQAGLGNLSDTLQTGTSRMLGDIGGLMPHMIPPQMHPFIQARHGMIGHEMSFLGSLGAIMDFNPFSTMNVPDTTTAYRFQELAARDLGDRLGTGMAMGGFYGAAAAGTFGLGTVGATAGFAMGGRMFDRWTGGIQQSRLGRIPTAMRMGAGAIGGIAGLAPVFAAEAFVSSIGEDIGHRQQLSNFMEASSFRFATGVGADIDQHFGSGFNPRARARIAGDMMNVARSDRSLDFDDMHTILQSGTEMDLFQGTQDVESFSQRFRDLTDTVKTVTRTLHQTLEEGMRTIRELRDQGFDSPEQMRHAVSTADILGTASGRTAAEMLSIGRQGAEMVRGTGISMGVGSEMMQRTMSFVDQMHHSGILSEEHIRQAGGAGQLAQRMMAQNINFMQGRVGRGMMMGMTGPGGVFDAGAFGQFTSGAMSLQDVAGAAMQSTTTSADFIGQIINREANMRAMSEQFGGMGLQFAALGGYMAEGTTLAQMHGLTNRQGMEFAMIQAGLSESERAAHFGMIDNVDQFAATQMQALNVRSREGAMELVRRHRERPGFLRRNIGGVVDAIAGDVHLMSTAIGESVSGAARGVNQRVNEIFFGAPRIVDDMQAISRSDAARIMSQPGFAGGGGLTAMMSRDIFTADEASDFAETDAFNEIVSNFGSAVSGDALRATDLEDYAQAVAGKSFSELTREERMALSQRARVTNNRAMIQAFDDRYTSSARIIRSQGNRRIDTSQAAVEGARETLQTARREAVRRLGRGSDIGHRLTNLFTEDSEAREIFDDLLAGRGDRDTLTEQFMSRVMGSDIATIRQAAPRIADALAGANLGDLGEGVAGALDTLGAADDQLARERMVSSVEERLGRVSGGRDFRAGRRTLLSIMRGEGATFEEGQLRRFASAAAETGEAGLAGILRQATKISADGVTFEEASRKRLTQLSAEEFREHYGDRMSQEQFLQLEVATVLGDRQGGPRLVGGSGGRDMIEAELEFADSLVKAKSDMTDILGRLESLATRLEKK